MWFADPSTLDPVGIDFSIGDLFSEWIFSPQDCVDFFDKPTILRILMNIGMATNAGSGGTGAALWSWGIINATAGDFSGTPPIYDPRAQGYFDWLATGNLAVIGAPGTAHPVTFYGMNQTGPLIDIRSRRIIEPGEGLLFCAASEVTSDSAVKTYMQGRVLLAH